MESKPTLSNTFRSNRFTLPMQRLAPLHDFMLYRAHRPTSALLNHRIEDPGGAFLAIKAEHHPLCSTEPVLPEH